MRGGLTLSRVGRCAQVRARTRFVARLPRDSPEDEVRPCGCKVHQLKPRSALRVAHCGGRHIRV